MKLSTECLEASQVDSLLQGNLTPEGYEAAQNHLELCETCRARVEETIGPEQWWGDVQSVLLNSRSSLFSKAQAAEDAEPNDTPTTKLLDLLGPTDDPNMLGRIGPYEIIGLLGQGGMGAVFKGFDRSLNRFVAIKMLLPHLAASGAARKRFAREGQAVAAVVDDHVMAIHCVDEWQGVPYLVMTYSRGVSLQKRLSDKGPLEVREILRIGMQAAKGLAAAHAQGIVHRDIKPANIFLDQNVERVQLMDFGLARAVDDASLTRSGTLAGTPQYMSPEQARAETVDHRSDLFSLGSVMYAMCTGHAPFRAESSYSVLRLITDKEPRPIRETYPDVPDWLCAIISKLMAKQADDRFVSASVVAELIEESLAHVQQPTTTPLPDAVAKLVKSFGTGTDTHPTKSFDDFRYPPIGKFIAAAAFAFSLIFAGFLIVLELNKGTLTIECEADDVPIRIMKGVEIVEKLTVVRSGSTTRLQAGVYTVEIDDPNSELSIANNHISLSRGANSIVKIQYSLDLTKVTSPAQDHASVKDAKEEVIDDIILKAENSTLDRIEGPVQNAVDSELSFDPPLEELNFNELGFADREVTVTMTARLAGLNLGGNRVGNANSILLCSDSNLPPSSHSVMVFVSQDAAEQIERLGITQPKEHFLNRRVEVKGRLHQIGAGTEGKKPGRTGPFEISVLEASQIQVLRFHGPTKKIAASEAEPLAPRPEIERDSERATNSTKRVMQDSSEAQENDTAAKNAISNQATGYPDWLVAWDFRYTLMNQRYAMMRISKDGKLEAIFPEQPMVRSQLTLEELAEIVDLVAKNPQSKTQPMSTIADYSLDVRPRPELFDEIKRVNVRSEIVAAIHNGELLELELKTTDSYFVGNHLWKLVGLAAIGGSKELPKFVQVANRELKRNFPNVSDEITSDQFSYGIVDRPSGNITIWFDFKIDSKAKIGKVVLRIPQDGQPSMEKVVFPELELPSTKPTEKSETSTELPPLPNKAIPLIEKPKVDKGQESDKPLPIEGHRRNPKLPIDRYVKSGVPLADQTWPMPPWGEERDGLSVGLRVIGDAHIGGEVKAELWVRNSSAKDVKFSQCLRADVGLKVVAKDKDGKEHSADITQFRGYPVFHQLLLPPEHIVKVKEFNVKFGAGKNDKLEPGWVNLQLTPGDYKLRAVWSDTTSRGADEGEWTGKLTTGEVDLEIAAANAGADAGKPAAKFPGEKIAKLPDSAYAKVGIPIGELDKPIEWSGVVTEGLCMGIHVPEDAVWRVGGEVKAEVWVYNASETDAKFSRSPRTDVGLSIIAKGADGKEHFADITQFLGRPGFSRLLLPPGNIVKLKELTMKLGAKKDGERVNLDLPPGDYKLRAVWSDTTSMVAPEGEWTGKLTSGEVNLSVAASDAKLEVAKPNLSEKEAASKP